MSPEIKIAFSREVPRGACVVGRQEDENKYVPISITDCQGTDLMALGIARKMLKDGETPVFVFGSEDEMEENADKIRMAFDDYNE
ncbi:MAG: hypothetical protein KatS3mg101_0992 [Patescibacteria group bacterium]|nr:MAG: hypothetical protein KatS3mg101_0992 [Patescibacteria group bacterium]